MPDEPTRVVRCDRGDVELRFAGPRGADVVLLLHGGHFRAGLPLGEAAFLAAGHRLLVPSRPGYGHTAPAAGPGPEAFADTLAELCERTGTGTLRAVVGVSAGGPTAVALAARHPGLVRSLVLHSARADLPFPDGAARIAARVAFTPRAEAATWAASGAFLRRFPGAGLRSVLGPLSTLPAGRVLADLTGAECAELVDVLSRMRSGAGFAADLRERVDPGPARAVRVPALVVASRTDGQVRFAHAERWAALVPGAVLAESPALSHLLWYGSGAAETARLTERFLAAA
ncbi:alpha/beta fold hydrolase [Kineococcus terrestris]|uniref:alpha/beta fold hydrolase n=1 Tax=Kineococcus terrestris TaxID=2044856 RepID=UPI0034DB2F55